MGRKVVYKLALKAMPSPALTSLPKRTRSLLLQIQVAKESKQYDEADRLLGELGDLYEEVGDVEKMIDVAKQELEVGDNLGPKDGAKARNRAYFRLSRGYRELECFDAAIDSAKEYIKSSQYLQDNSELLQGYFELALTYTARWESHEQSPSDNEDAESAWRSAAALLKWLPRDKKEDIKADINLNLGITLKNASEYDRSLLHMNKALEHYIKSGNKSDEAKAYFNISAVHHAKGQGDQSIHYAWKEQKLLHEMGDLQSEARSYWELAIRCKDYWHYEEAIGALKAYKSLCDMLDDDEGTAQATTAITDAQECIEKEGRIQDLTLRLNAAKHGSVPLRKQFDLYGERGELLLGLGKHALAIYDFEEQKRLAFLLKLPKLPTEKLLYHLGLSYAGENRHEEALKAYREALDKFEGTGAERLVILLKLADSYQETSGPYELMCRTYDQVVTLAEQLGDLEMQREALSQLVWINQKRGFEAKAAGFQARLSDVEAIIEAAGTSLGNDESMEPELGSADPDMLRDAGSDSGPRNGIPSSTSIPNNSVAPRKTATIPQPVAPAKPKDRTAKYQIHTIVDDLSLDFDQSNPPSPSKTKRKPRVSIPQPTPITIIDSDSDTGIDEFPATSAAAPRVGNGAKNVLNEDEDDEEADIPLLPRSGLSGTSSPFSNRKSLTAKRKESPPSSKRAVIKKSRLRIDSSSPPPSQSQRSQQLLFPRSTGNASIRATVSREEDENRDLSMLPLNMSPLRGMYKSQPLKDKNIVGVDEALSYRPTQRPPPAVAKPSFPEKPPEAVTRPYADQLVSSPLAPKSTVPGTPTSQNPSQEEITTPTPRPLAKRTSSAHQTTVNATTPRMHTTTTPSSATTPNSPAPRRLFGPGSGKGTPRTPTTPRTPGSLVMRTGRTRKTPTSGASARTLTPRNLSYLHHQEPPFKIRVAMETPEKKHEIFAITCPPGPNGTPKTVSWLLEEARRRFSDVYKYKPPVLKLVTTDPDTGEEETLGKGEVVRDVLTHKQKVVAVPGPRPVLDLTKVEAITADI